MVAIIETVRFAIKPVFIAPSLSLAVNRNAQKGNAEARNTK